MQLSPLSRGDTVGIITPCHVGNPLVAKRVEVTLRAFGLSMKTGEHCFDATYGYDASDGERAADLMEMVQDPAVKMIFFGGGEGAEELLPLLGWKTISMHPKYYASYSDGTSLLVPIFLKAGIPTFYGISPAFFQNPNAYDLDQFSSWFLEDKAKPAVQGEAIVGGAAEGLLIGGYSRNIALLLGGNYFPYDPNQRYILFIEDHYTFSPVGAVSSYLSHIEQSPFINNVDGLLFGHYDYPMPDSLTERLERFGEKHHIPVMQSDLFGHHIEKHVILPIGQKVRLDGDAGTLSFLS